MVIPARFDTLRAKALLAKNPLWETLASGAQQESQSNPYYEGGRVYYRSQNFLYCIGER